MRIIAVVILFIPLFNIAQSRIVVKGSITDEYGDPIKTGVKIVQASFPASLVNSDDNGDYIFRYSYSGNQDDGLIFHSTWFQDKTIRITKKLVKRTVGDTLYLNVKLSYIMLEGPVVTRDKVPEVVFGHPVKSVQDFELYAGRLVLLTFEKSLKRGAEVILSEGDSILSRHSIPGEAVRLFKDYLDRIYVVCKEQVFICSFRNNQVAISKIVSDEFYDHTWRILDKLDGKLYYSNVNEIYPAYEYFSQIETDTLSQRLHYVEDELVMDLYRAEYKYANGQEKLWAVRKEMATGIEKEIWIGAKYFTNSMYYKVPYAPLFIKEDTVLIFDHYKDLLYKFNKQDSKVDSVPIYYHKLTRPVKWKQPLLSDESTEQIYGLFMKSGHYHLKEIQTETGLASRAFRVYYKFVETLKIDNGFAYYIYRPYESAQERYIYREKIGL